MTWRVGRQVGRTLYRDEVLVGLVDTAELAAEIVQAMAVLAAARALVAQQDRGDGINRDFYDAFDALSRAVRGYKPANKRWALNFCSNCGSRLDCEECATPAEPVDPMSLVGVTEMHTASNYKPEPDPLHPSGRCTCGGEGSCMWCLSHCTHCGAGKKHLDLLARCRDAIDWNEFDDANCYQIGRDLVALLGEKP